VMMTLPIVSPLEITTLEPEPGTPRNPNPRTRENPGNPGTQGTYAIGVSGIALL
jgi:hypothetical protein